MAALAKSASQALMKYGKPRFATFLKYGKSELTPPSPTELPAAFAAAAKLVQSGVTMQWRNLTVKEAWLNTLVATEVVCWFFVGECIGKGSLVAYKV